VAAKAAARGVGRFRRTCCPARLAGRAGGQSFKVDFFVGIALPVFRATGVAWAAAKYPAQATKLVDAAAAAAPRFAAVRASTTATFAVVSAARAAASVTGADEAAQAAEAAYFAADAYADAATAAAAADAYAYAEAAHAAEAADAADAAAAAPLWASVSIDATRVEGGAAASVIAGSPLWPQPQGQPDQLQSLWQEMKAVLYAAGQDWQVWTIWYDDRLAGHVRDETRELAYVRIEEALWNQGPAIVNAAIKRLIEEHERPAPVENVP
jgi:hypothetical protein